MNKNLHSLKGQNTANQLLENDPNLKQIREKLIRKYQPLQLFLFGSRATNTNRADSDYDLLLVVKKREGSRLDNLNQARALFFDSNFSVDISVYTEKEFEDWKNELNSIAEVAYTLGVEIPLG